MTAVRVAAFGDAAVLLELGGGAVVADARLARRLARAINALRVREPRLGVPVAAAASVLVPFDPRASDAGEVEALLAPAIAALAVMAADGPEPESGQEHIIPVRYGGADGPDLEDVAAALGLDAWRVIELHAGSAYEVLFAGFAPGFAYLGQLPVALRVPRLATPRTRVPAGSVAIAGAMTAVYPQASPGGWRVLGRTDIPLFDPAATPPARLRPGDRVRFVPA
jgi:KipI family sensor histidine kinase inhibitor